MTYGKATMAAMRIEIFRCTKNWAETSMLIRDIEKSSPSHLYRMKSGVVGQSTALNSRSGIARKTMETRTMAPIERNKVPLNTSRWSQKDISPSWATTSSRPF